MVSKEKLPPGDGKMTFYEFIKIDFLRQRIMNNFCATEYEVRGFLNIT